MTAGYVHTKRKGNVAYLTFFHPAHNSLPAILLGHLEQSIVSLGDDPEIRVIVLQSEGDRTFCAGASFDELRKIDSEQCGKEFFLGFAGVINAMRKSPCLVICRVQGKAVGGALGLIAASDYVVANKYASVRLSELSIGIGPFVIEPAITRKIGLAAMSELALNPLTFFGSDWCRTKGLYQEVVEVPDSQLHAVVSAKATEWAAYNPEALVALKMALWSDTEHWDDLLDARAKISGQLVNTDFAQRAISEVFVEKKSSGSQK